MMVRQICSRKKTERICGEDFPREIVKSAMLKVDVSVLQNALEQIRHTDGVQNFERYLISTLFNEANGKRFKFNKSDFEIGNAYGAVWGMNILAGELPDEILKDFLEMQNLFCVNIHVEPLDQMTALAVRSRRSALTVSG